MVITRDDITLGIAILGAVLGVFNLWLNWKRERVSLKVIPRFFFGVGPAGEPPGPTWAWTNKKGKKFPKFLCVEIRNKGVSVWVNEVGFLMKGSAEKAVILDQFHPYRIDIPFRLEPHSSKTVYVAELQPEALEVVSKYKCAYATVASGKQLTGKSPMLKELWKYGELANELKAAS